MEYRSFLIKYGEIGVKGKNRRVFEDALMKQIRVVLRRIDGDFYVSGELGRIYVEASGSFDAEEAIAAMSKVFGIVAISPMVRIEDRDFENLQKEAVSYIKNTYPDKPLTFKVDTRRADKSYPHRSDEINAKLGESILMACPNLRVDVKNPDILLKIEIRNHINLYSRSVPGPGGMPVGTNGKALLLLSGGIDSPVAGYMTAKRGVKLEAVYFHAPPYTSERAKQKVKDLASLVAEYAGPINLHIVNFTEMQLRMYEHCPHDELTIIMRRYMMKIAEKIARMNGDQALVTGESIGQVASQTMWSLAATDAAVSMPVFRPLIGFDKQEIVELSEKINTFETSILPYEDCCTVFVSKHPVTKPELSRIEKSEEKLGSEIEEMLEKAIRERERVVCSPGHAG